MIKTNPFKVGDKVRCINDHGSDVLVAGHDYIVQALDVLCGEPQIQVHLPRHEDQHLRWYTKRFVKA